jgi:hypothetical protein
MTGSTVIQDSNPVSSEYEAEGGGFVTNVAP